MSYFYFILNNNRIFILNSSPIIQKKQAACLKENALYKHIENKKQNYYNINGICKINRNWMDDSFCILLSNNPIYIIQMAEVKSALP